jgi:hypothetical protein
MKKVLTVVALLVALSACHAGVSIVDNGQNPTSTSALGSAVAQASLGSVATTNN